MYLPISEDRIGLRTMDLVLYNTIGHREAPGHPSDCGVWFFLFKLAVKIFALCTCTSSRLISLGTLSSCENFHEQQLELDIPCQAAGV